MINFFSRIVNYKSIGTKLILNISMELSTKKTLENQGF